MLRYVTGKCHKSSLVNNLILSSRAPTTRSSYETYIRRWLDYCKKMQLNPYNDDHKEAMSLIAELFHEQNHNYGVPGIVRFALSAILPKQKGKTFGQDEIISQIMKGIFKVCPSLSKYTVTCYPDLMLKYMNQLPKNEEHNLEVLTKELATHLCLLNRLNQFKNFDLTMLVSETTNVNFIFLST